MDLNSFRGLTNASDSEFQDWNVSQRILKCGFVYYHLLPNFHCDHAKPSLKSRFNINTTALNFLDLLVPPPLSSHRCGAKLPIAAKIHSTR